MEILNKIFNENMLTGLDKVPAGFVDLILTDLPYGTTACKWDQVIPFAPMWEQFERVAKPNAAIVLTASQPFTSALVMSNPRLFKYSFCWVKNKSTGHLNANRQPLRSFEDVAVFYKTQPVYNPQKTTGHKKKTPYNSKQKNKVFGNAGENIYQATEERMPGNVLFFDVVNNDDPERINATQKPVALFEYLIKTYTNPGAVVLDATAGSGTTAIACMNTGRNYICFEWDPNAPHDQSFAKAVNRIEQHAEQLRKEKSQLKQGELLP